MSIIGTAIGTPATIDSFVRRIPSRSHNATSVEVPPMSKVMMFAKPPAAPARRAPTPPPAGPDRIARTGSLAAAAAEMRPPDDCMTRNFGAPASGWLFADSAGRGPAYPERRDRYRPINGCKYAFTATVEVRSYSRYSGKI